MLTSAKQTSALFIRYLNFYIAHLICQPTGRHAAGSKVEHNCYAELPLLPLGLKWEKSDYAVFRYNLPMLQFAFFISYISQERDGQADLGIY